MSTKHPLPPSIVPVMLAFFTMGFVDLIGIATNYVKSDFALSDTVANSLSVMVFIWFLVLSVPTGILMDRIGRRNTVMVSLLTTFLALLVPVVFYSKAGTILSFSLIGIGNTLMQVSLNPLLSNIVREKQLPSSLTLGQFIKAVASFSAPIIAAQGAIRCGNWRLLFVLFAAVCLLALVCLFFTPISEPRSASARPASFRGSFSLLGNGAVLLLFLGILVHVGIDVGINITAPRLVMERTGATLASAGYATSVYFLFRTLGCFAGTFLLARFPLHRVFLVSASAVAAGIAGLFFCYSAPLLLGCIAWIGAGNSNVFPIIFSRGLGLMPSRANELSGLMIMGIAGGAVFPPLMGFASDGFGSQLGAVAVLAACGLYLLLLAPRIKDSRRGR